MDEEEKEGENDREKDVSSAEPVDQIEGVFFSRYRTSIDTTVKTYFSILLLIFDYFSLQPCGWLQKRDVLGDSWKRRWFLLDERRGKLFYCAKVTLFAL